MDKNEDKKKEKKEEEFDETEVDNQDVEETFSKDRELEEKLRECEFKYKRALADYQNLEKRNISDRAEWIKSANREMLLRILPIVDTLMLAKKHDDNKTLEIALAQFLDILKAEGVIQIETIGKKFDPAVMECLEIVEEGDTVIEEIRTGYLLYDKLLRPAQVRVGKGK